MKIAVWHNLPSGGGKRALNHLVEGLLARGHRIESWSPPTADLSYLPLGSLIREHIVPFLWKKPQRHEGLSDLLWRHRETADKIVAMDQHCERCAAEIGADGFDLLFAHPCAFFRVASIGRFAKIPTVLYLQEPNRDLYEASPKLPWVALPRRSRRAWSPYAIRRTLEDLVDIRTLRLRAREEHDNAAAFDRILVNSHFSRESVLRAYGLDSRVCYLGVAADLFRPLGLARGRTVVGLGAIHPSKGIDTAIKAVATIPEQARPKLLWIGNFAVPGYQSELEGLAKSLAVEFVPRIRVSDDEVVDLLNRAAVLVYTSRLEPFGLAPLEANACETPVVAIAEGGVRESIQTGLNGTLIPDRCPEAIGQALAKFLDDPAWARTVGQRARINAVENWNWERAVECVERSLIEVVRERQTIRLARCPAENPGKGVLLVKLPSSPY
jgi:glycosyltransferase involved in cell wall biosynthesis